eukprot:10486210-Alexandrium_andersonii.AAC.1
MVDSLPIAVQKGPMAWQSKRAHGCEVMCVLACYARCVQVTVAYRYCLALACVLCCCAVWNGLYYVGQDSAV